MKNNPSIHLSDVQDVYTGPEKDMWELIMGEQIHIGGLTSSMDLADKAGIGAGMSGVDLCCCTGAGMRFLLRFQQVASMTGVDATERMITEGCERAKDEGFEAQTTFVLADACDTGLPSDTFDFAWGEDAWVYVEDKQALIDEAVRLVKPGGVIAFTDWIEGAVEMTEEEAQRFLSFMKFPNVQDRAGYADMLTDAGCNIILAEDTRRFAPHVDLYLNMVGMQFTYDALKLFNFDQSVLEFLAGEMQFMSTLAHAGKIFQGLFVARK
jgi:ubiquinone/menaquinone biosynthesis C-methylase UbiE